VGNVDYFATEEEIETLFNQFGEVITVYMPKDSATLRGAKGSVLLR